MRSEVLKADNLYKSYFQGGERLEILKGASLSLHTDSFVALLGASGSGKSTLLHVLGLLDSLDQGEISFEGKNVSNFSEDKKAKFRLQHLGFVFQFHHLIPELSALENVTLPASMLGRDAKALGRDAKAEAEELLHWVGLKDRMNSFPWQLSGGEQQRVALGRALINRPKILLTDEVTGNLDRPRSLEILDLLARIHAERKTAILSVTHDERLAQSYKSQWRLESGLIVEQNQTI